jgi:elongation factor 1-beta
MPAFASVDELNKHLATRSYVEGYSMSAADTVALATLKGLPAAKSHPHAYRWSLHILALTGNSASFLGGAAAAPAASSGAKKAAAANDDDMDLFGDDDEDKPVAKKGDDNIFDYGEDDEVLTEEEKAAAKARQARMAAAKKLKDDADAKAGKKKSEKPVERSLVVLEVKPWEADTNLEMVWNLIKERQQEGLNWGESFKLEPVAYGIMKLVMTCTIVDSLVLMDDITDHIESLEDYVQSVQVASMNKL